MEQSDSPSKALIVYVSEGIHFSQQQDTAACSVQYLDEHVVARGCTGIGVYCDDSTSGEEQVMRSLYVQQGGEDPLRIYKDNVVMSGFVTHEDQVPILEKSRVGKIQRIFHPDIQENTNTHISVDSVDSVADSIMDAFCNTTGGDASDIVCLLVSPKHMELSPLGWTNDLIRRLDAIEGFSSNVFLCLITECRGFDILGKEKELLDGTSGLSLIRPPQSFMFRGASKVPIDSSKVGVFVYRLPGSTRIDDVESLADINGVYSKGGGKCIQIERILYEVAYKVGHSLKYGA
ncbi:hypothetical protein M9434_002126 [Picochlorum sp. BPE23]|nr:hypothetical protein M9434_002126 [Picochlorum sp. BPE23]